ncbi:DUF3570 domain-containing protein [bacterium]|nr:DUF3570 domain-containing protein [bacterium]
MTLRSGRNGAAVVLAAAVLTVAGGVVRGAAPQLADNTAGYAMNFFSDVEGVHVYTQYVDSAFRLSDQVAAGIEWVHDRVVIPAIDAPPGSAEAIDGITSASRPILSEEDAFKDYVKVRNSLQGTMNWSGAGLSYYVSDEDDYFAQMLAAAYAADFMDDNFNLAAGLSYGWDDIRALQQDGSRGSAYRHTSHVNLVATQIVTPSLRLRVGAELNLVRGQQHDPYRSVYVGGGIEPELHPDHRSRRDVFVNLSQYLGNESSLKLDYRYYDDNWSVRSHTWGVRLAQRISRPLTVRYRYRYYTQGAAWFYRDDYRGGTSIDGYQTADYRLGDYGAHLFGGHVIWRPESLFGGSGILARTELRFTYERYFNSNNFTANVFETSVSVTF